MGILTFKGGVHPYDGKELSKNSPVVNICQREIWYILFPSISVLRRAAIVQKGGPCARRTEDRRCCGVVSSPIHSSVSGTVKESTAPDSNRFYGQFHYH